MQPISVTVGPLAAADDNGICTTQKPAAGGVQNLTLNGALVVSGVAVMDVPRRVIITSDGNDSSHTFVITGTTFNNVAVSETLAGPNAGAVSSTVDFLTVTSITINTNATGNLIVGTNGVAGSRWVFLDSWANAETAIQCNGSGTVNYTIQVTMDNPNDPISPVGIANVTWLNTDDPDAITAIGDIYSNFQFTPVFARILLNSGTGSVTGTFSQFNVVNL